MAVDTTGERSRRALLMGGLGAMAATVVSAISCRMRTRPRHGRITLRNKKISQKSQGIK